MKEPYHELPINKRSDAAIYVLSRISGEGMDREVVEGDATRVKRMVEELLK